jgi:hypothetical protein
MLVNAMHGFGGDMGFYKTAFPDVPAMQHCTYYAQMAGPMSFWTEGYFVYETMRYID